MIHRNKEDQRRLAKYCHQSGRFKGIGFVFADIWFDDWNEDSSFRYRRGYKKGMKSLKKYGNRKIRRYKGDLKNGGHCYKVFNAKWEYF